MSAQSKHALAVLVASALGAGSGFAQGSWSMVTGGLAPPAQSPVMVFDSARNVSVLVVYGGGRTTHVLERNGSSWALAGIGSSNNNALVHAAAAFDSGRGVTVVFGGGLPPEGYGNDFAEWDGTTWVDRNAVARPPARGRHAMAYDAARGQTLLFGGVVNTTSYVAAYDTWTWNGTSWVQRTPLVFPAARAGHAMAYDANRQRVVLFGGTDGAAFHADTWEWDGTTWIERTPVSGPSPGARHEHAMAYDSGRGVTYLFGGANSAGAALNDLWAWDGTRWTQLLGRDPPSRRWDTAIAFDGSRGRLVLFGGLNAPVPGPAFAQLPSGPYTRDTWEYTPGLVGSFDAFGSGCAGSRGVPALRATAGPPVAGQSFRVQVDNLPLSGPAFVFLGASNTLYGALPLPFPLGIVGMPGCSLLVSGDTLFPVTNVLGVGLWTVDVPASVAGAILYQQAFAVDPGANAAGLTASHGARLQIGG
jgi:hypothetical protein